MTNGALMRALTFQRPVNDPRAYVSLLYGAYYSLGFHTGIDIVSQEGSCAHWPIQSAAWGVVTYAERVTAPGFTVWGNLIIVASTLPDDTVVFCRYAHVENMQVKAGDTVHPGQHIADIGDAFGQYVYHLHYDISPTIVLATTPWDWPGQDLARVRRDYVDPCSFIRERETMATDYTALDAALNNLQAATADMNAAVKAFETPDVPPVEPAGVDMTVTSDNGLNVRQTPVTGKVLFTLRKGDAVRVIDASPSPWKQITKAPIPEMVGLYCSGAFLAPKA